MYFLVTCFQELFLQIFFFISRYALKNNFPVLEHVTLPRVGAMDVILDTLRPEKIKEALENGEGTLLTGQFHQKCSSIYMKMMQKILSCLCIVCMQ